MPQVGKDAPYDGQAETPQDTKSTARKKVKLQLKAKRKKRILMTVEKTWKSRPSFEEK